MAAVDPIMQKNPISKRSAVFEDDGVSAWLYLTGPNSEQPVRDCWIYNRIAPPDPSEMDKYRGGPPPACAGHASADDTFIELAPPEVIFVWSPSGNDVAVRVNGTVLGFVSSATSAGYSRLLVKTGPWGRTWNQAIYSSLFGNSD